MTKTISVCVCFCFLFFSGDKKDRVPAALVNRGFALHLYLNITDGCKLQSSPPPTSTGINT